MSENEKTQRHVLFVSDSTGITVETLGRNLLNQFSMFQFVSHTFRFVNDEVTLQEVIEKIRSIIGETQLRPIVISTLIDKQLRQLIMAEDVFYLDIFDTFIEPLETELQASARLGMGKAHGIVNDKYYAERIDAVNYTVKTDDGVRISEYDNADVILVGVSRTGKTPTSLYLALHYGLATANYPIIDDDLESPVIPKFLNKYKDKIFGLMISPDSLQKIRQKRRPDSPYASLPQCQYEIRQSEQMFIKSDIPFFNTTNMSVEEVASLIISQVQLKPRTFVP